MTYFNDEQLLEEIRDYASRCLGPRRAAIILTLAELVGLDPADERYQEELYADDPPSRRKALAVGSATEKPQSGCGVTVERGLVKGARVKDPRFRLGFDIRGAKGGVLAPITLQIAVARAAGCWHDTTVWVEGDPLPLEGDNWVIGLRGVPGWARNAYDGEHTGTVGRMHPRLTGGGPRLVSGPEGGQPGIRLRTRGIVEVWTKESEGKRSGELWLANVEADGQVMLDADGRPHTGRRMLGFCDVDGLDCDDAA